MGQQKILAWHFMRADDNGKPVLRDGTPVTAGETISVEGELVLGKWGLHACVRALDAVGYAAPRKIVARVEQWGDMQHGDDVFVARHRRILWVADASYVLHTFACDVAEQALDDVEASGETVDSRSHRAIKVKRQWLEGGTTNAELEAAGRAAHAAASVAPRKTIHAELAAAMAAERYAAKAAARAGAWAGPWDTQNDKLEAILLALAPQPTAD